MAQLKCLAADVRAILGTGTKIGYAANWDEYGAYQPHDGGGDVLFPLDPLWADDDIDFVGVDFYAPLSDWRAGTQHLDAQDWQRIHDREYLKANIEGGENYEWYYNSEADREAQSRTPIVDTAHGEDWVFRAKDIRHWWENEHHERPGGCAPRRRRHGRRAPSRCGSPRWAARRSTWAPTSPTCSMTRNLLNPLCRTTRRACATT